MELTVKLYGTLRKYRPNSAGGAPHQPFTISVPENGTVMDLIHSLAIAEGSVNAAAVNGDAVESDTLLHGGDVVSLFPPAAGGAR
ncbi:MAG: MoaD/ThiS family protein [Candidatus Promineifilaceae bacterium]